MDAAQIKHMVSRFLMWKLPENFNPDGGISFTRYSYKGVPYEMPVGTNLLDATQAEAMVRHMVEGMPQDGGQTQFCWLIEAPGPSYLTAEDWRQTRKFAWTTVPHFALRFHSEEQADNVMMVVRSLTPDLFAFAICLGIDAKAVEHGFTESA